MTITDELPQELINAIVSLVHPNDLLSCSLLSRQWREATLPRMLASVKVYRGSPSDLPSMFAKNPRLFSYIKILAIFSNYGAGIITPVLEKNNIFPNLRELVLRWVSWGDIAISWMRSCDTPTVDALKEALQLGDTLPQLEVVILDHNTFSSEEQFWETCGAPGMSRISSLKLVEMKIVKSTTKDVPHDESSDSAGAAIVLDDGDTGRSHDGDKPFKLTSLTISSKSTKVLQTTVQTLASNVQRLAQFAQGVNSLTINCEKCDSTSSLWEAPSPWERVLRACPKMTTLSIPAEGDLLGAVSPSTCPNLTDITFTRSLSTSYATGRGTRLLRESILAPFVKKFVPPPSSSQQVGQHSRLRHIFFADRTILGPERPKPIEEALLQIPWFERLTVGKNADEVANSRYSRNSAMREWFQARFPVIFERGMGGLVDDALGASSIEHERK